MWFKLWTLKFVLYYNNNWTKLEEMTDNFMTGSEFTTILLSGIIKIRYNNFHFYIHSNFLLKNLSSEISVLQHKLDHLSYQF